MTEFVEAILAQVIGNLSTVLIILIFYFNFLLFESYLRLIVWAILFSQALRQAKNNVISVLQYLSDDPDVETHGLLTCVFSKSCEILLYHPTGSRRTGKELFLNYGIFVFTLVGAVSIWMRMYSIVSFLHLSFGVFVVLLSLIKILDRRIFYYRYFISDDVLVSLLLILGFFVTGIFVMFYLGTESYMEGSRAAAGLSTWIQKNFINDERTREIWSEQVENSRLMISAALSGIENKYNDTMWWPPVKSLVKTYYLDAKAGDGNLTTTEPLYTRFGLPENMTLFQIATLAYSKVDSVNLTSVQLTDWTSKGIEVSSIAFGSVAQLIFLFFTLIIAFVSLGIRAFFFISSLFYLLCTNWDPIERFVEDLLPIQVDKRPQVVTSLRKVVEGVFFLPLKMSSLHALVTLVSFTLVNADFVYLATTFTFLISIVPIIPPYLVCLPWVASIWVTSSFIKAIALFGVQYFAFTLLDDMLYEKSIVALNSYVSALSVVFGVYVFGFEGVIFGPLSVCAVTFAYEVSNHGIQAAKDDYTRVSEVAGGSDQDDACLDEPTSAAESSVDDDDIKPEEESTPAEVTSPNASIFSNAMYRVISGPLVDRVRRRLSMDISTEDSICVTIVVEGLKNPRKVRFVVNKSWNQRALCENLRRMLHAHSVESITASDGSEVLSPLHIVANEVLHVRVRPKHRPPLFPSVQSASEPAISAASPRYRRTPGVVSPSEFTRRPSIDGISPGRSGPVSPGHLVSPSKSKMAVPIDLSMSSKHARSRLRRQHSVPIRADGDGILRRSGSYGVGGGHSPGHVLESQKNAATYEDVSSLLSPRTFLAEMSALHSGESLSEKRNSLELGSQKTSSSTPRSSTPSPKKDRGSLQDLLATPVSFDGSGSLDAVEANQQNGGANRPPLPTRHSDEAAEPQPTVLNRRHSVQLLSGCTNLLFSPLSLQEGSAVYPSDDEDAKGNRDRHRQEKANSVEDSSGDDHYNVAGGKSGTLSPTKTLCFDEVHETTDSPSSPEMSKFKYVSKAKAELFRQRKAEKDGSTDNLECDLF